MLIPEIMRLASHRAIPSQPQEGLLGGAWKIWKASKKRQINAII